MDIMKTNTLSGLLDWAMDNHGYNEDKYSIWAIGLGYVSRPPLITADKLMVGRNYEYITFTHHVARAKFF